MFYIKFNEFKGPCRRTIKIKTFYPKSYYVLVAF